MIPTEHEWEVSMEKEALPIKEDPPFKILLIDDFSGRANRLEVGEKLLPLPPFEIDRDSFEDALEKMDVSILVGNGKYKTTVRIREFDDLHPDNLVLKCGTFSELLEFRERLLDPREFENAAKDVRTWLKMDTEPEDKHLNPTGGASLLDDVLENRDLDAVEYERVGALEELLREAVGTHAFNLDEAEQRELLEIVDSGITRELRKVLKEKGLRRVEASLRGLWFFLRRIETSLRLKIEILDISKEELFSCLRGEAQFGSRDIVDLLTRSGDGEIRSVLGLGFDFEPEVDDLACLMRLAKVCRGLEISCFFGLEPQMLGRVDSKVFGNDVLEKKMKLWNTLRVSPDAEFLCALSPRVLGRMPYGAKSDVCERIEFEEIDCEDVQESFLWLSPVYPTILLLAQSFDEFGWEMRKHLARTVEGLPFYHYENDGDLVLTSSAEILISDSEMEILLEQGLSPLIAAKDSGRIDIPRLQSVSYPPKPIAGRW